MKRLSTRVQVDTCDRCGASVLTTNWDDLEAVYTDTIADPTPLDFDQQLACVLQARPLYYLEQTIAATFRLSNRNSHNLDRSLPKLVGILPAHWCGDRHDTALPVEVAIALTGGPARTVPDQPGWAVA